MGLRSIPGRLLDTPEVNVTIFAFLLNLTWEFAQVPLFAGMPTAEHWRAVLVCGQATLGDVVIALVGFWTVAICSRARTWVLRPAAAHVAGFVAVGVLITVVMEWLATRVLGRWTYAEAMPVIPLLGVGLAPLLQWIVLPPIVVSFRSTPAHVSKRALPRSYRLPYATTGLLNEVSPSNTSAQAHQICTLAMSGM